MIKRIFAGIAGIMVLISMLRNRTVEDIIDFDGLEDFQPAPGPWFKRYMNDWMEAFDIDDPGQVTSGIAIGDLTNEYIWATATPEWDRDWFQNCGWNFPARWVHFEVLLSPNGIPGDPIRLRGL